MRNAILGNHLNMMKQYNVYVIKQMVNDIACTMSYGCTWEVCKALKKLESHSAIASCDSYASFVLSNLPRAPITHYKLTEILRTL